MISAFWQIGATERASRLMSINFPGGRYRMNVMCMGLQGAPSGVKPSPVSSSISCLREAKGGSSVLTKRMVSLGWSPTVHTVQPCSDGDTCAGLMRPPKFVPNWGSRACPKPLHIA